VKGTKWSSHEDDFRTRELREGEVWQTFQPATRSSSDDKESVEVTMIRVTVETEGDVSLADFDVPESEWDAPAERGFAVLNAAHGLAERTVRDLVMMVRAGFDQYWLGPSTEAVRLVGASRLVEAESGVQLPPRGPVLTIARPKVSIRSLTSDDLIEVLARLGEGEAPSLAEALLVDAEYHVMEQEVPSGDPSRAVLLAAIACEVKVKASLRERTPPGGACQVE